jgi:hypothetical protein
MPQFFRRRVLSGHPGRLYLYIKTIERQHLPAKWWEEILLDRNYAKVIWKSSGLGAD